MAPNKRIFTIILIIKLVATISAARVGNRILPEEMLVAEIGEIRPNDHLTLIQSVSIQRAILYGRVRRQLIFHTMRNEIISQVRVLPFTGARALRMHNGPGSQNVTLEFISRLNSGIHKIVLLFGH